jgi:hypothetical protein
VHVNEPFIPKSQHKYEHTENMQHIVGLAESPFDLEDDSG